MDLQGYSRWLCFAEAARAGAHGAIGFVSPKYAWRRDVGKNLQLLILLDYSIWLCFAKSAHAGARGAIGFVLPKCERRWNVGKNLQLLKLLEFSIWLCFAKMIFARERIQIGFDLPECRSCRATRETGSFCQNSCRRPPAGNRDGRDPGSAMLAQPVYLKLKRNELIASL